MYVCSVLYMLLPAANENHTWRLMHIPVANKSEQQKEKEQGKGKQKILEIIIALKKKWVPLHYTSLVLMDGSLGTSISVSTSSRRDRLG